MKWNKLKIKGKKNKNIWKQSSENRKLGEHRAQSIAMVQYNTLFEGLSSRPSLNQYSVELCPSENRNLFPVH